MRLPSPCAHVPPRPQNFDQVVNGNQYVLVDFYAPWCSFCKALAPQYAAAAAQLKTMGIPVVIAKVAVDTAGGQAIGNRYNISTIPTLIWFSSGKPQIINHNDGDWSSSAAIVKWVASNAASAPSSSVTDEPCKNGRLDTLCLPIPAPAFYGILAAVVVHLLQAVAWIVVARTKLLFSCRHFCVVLFVPIFGLFLWLQLCRTSNFSKTAGNRDTLLSEMHGSENHA